MRREELRPEQIGEERCRLEENRGVKIRIEQRRKEQKSRGD